MRCPSLAELPPPPPGKMGWPWTEETPRVPDMMPDGSAWPRISIVTPSYNQGQFVEETIRSVLLQGYPDLEYMVVDGASADGSVEIIEKYDRWLAHWASEPDRGSSHAIDKGLRRATGDLAAWLNSDDYQMPEALQLAAQTQKAELADLVMGDCLYVDHAGNPVRLHRAMAVSFADLVTREYYICQPSCFFRRELYAAADGLNQDLHYAFDLDLWLKLFLNGPRIAAIARTLSAYRLHSSSKTVSGELQHHAEAYQVCFSGLKSLNDRRLNDRLRRKYGPFLIRKATADILARRKLIGLRLVLAGLWTRPSIVQHRSFWSALRHLV